MGKTALLLAYILNTKLKPILTAQKPPSEKTGWPK
jgi:hypothetical protein